MQRFIDRIVAVLTANPFNVQRQAAVDAANRIVVQPPHDRAVLETMLAGYGVDAANMPAAVAVIEQLLPEIRTELRLRGVEIVADDAVHTARAAHSFCARLFVASIVVAVVALSALWAGLSGRQWGMGANDYAAMAWRKATQAESILSSKADLNNVSEVFALQARLIEAKADKVTMKEAIEAVATSIGKVDNRVRRVEGRVRKMAKQVAELDRQLKAIPTSASQPRAEASPASMPVSVTAASATPADIKVRLIFAR